MSLRARQHPNISMGRRYNSQQITADYRYTDDITSKLRETIARKSDHSNQDAKARNKSRSRKMTIHKISNLLNSLNA
jgi:hypothetical protein